MNQKRIIFLNIAGFIIRIIFEKTKQSGEYEDQFIESVVKYYRGFIADASPKINFSVVVKYRHHFQVVVQNNQKIVSINFYRQLNDKKIETYYHVSGTQFQIIIRQITHTLLARHNGFILHASASEVGRKAVLFLGDSGAGKSTTMTMLASEFAPLGDDSVIIKKEIGEYYCYSSSALEKNAWFAKDNQKRILKALFFIEKSNESSYELITNKMYVLKLLTKQLFSEKNDINTQISNLAAFIDTFNSFYKLKVSLKKQKQLVKLIKSI